MYPINPNAGSDPTMPGTQDPNKLKVMQLLARMNGVMPQGSAPAGAPTAKPNIMRGRVPALDAKWMKGGTGMTPNQEPNKRGNMEEKGLPGLQDPQNPGGPPMAMQKPAKQGSLDPKNAGGGMNFQQNRPAITR